MGEQYGGLIQMCRLKDKVYPKEPCLISAYSKSIDTETIYDIPKARVRYLASCIN